MKTSQEIFNNELTVARVAPEATKPVVLDYIRRHEAARLKEYWTALLGAESSYNKGSIRAFQATRGDGAARQSEYLSASALKLLLGNQAYSNQLEAIRVLRASGDLDFQRTKLLEILPDRRELATPLLTSINAALAPDLGQMLESSADVQGFVNQIITELRNETAAPFFPFRYNELLATLWANDLVQYPLDVWEWGSRWKWSALTDEQWVGSTIADFIKNCLTYVPSKGEFPAHAGIIYTFLATSSVKAASTLTGEHIDAFCNSMRARIEVRAESKKKDYYYRLRANIQSCEQAFKRIYNVAFPNNPILLVKEEAGRDTSLKGSGTFEWLTQCSPQLSLWTDVCKSYILQLKTATTSGPISRLNTWLRFLLSLEAPPIHPLQVSRRLHIRNPENPTANTYYAYLLPLKQKKNTKSSGLRELRDLFDWYAEQLFELDDPNAQTFKNPVAITDNFGKDDSPRQSFRDALPSYVLEEMKLVLIGDDFAFPRTLDMCYAHVLNNNTGQASVEFYPGYAACTYQMLEAPIRSHQARWYDSGDLDEFLLDTKTSTLIRNPSQHAIAGRKEAMLRLHTDSLRNEKWFGLWVNTNKTQLYDREEHGYSIPFASDASVRLIDQMITWERTYLSPITKPLAYYSSNQESLVNPEIVEKGPQVAPLFRDPAIPGGLQPIKYSRLVTFYSKTLYEVQRRIKEKYNQDIRLAEVSKDGTIDWLVDMHTLRVSGITAMIESGVPLEVVSQFVASHATIVMTLHYLKYSPAKLREILRKARETAEASRDFAGSEVFFDRIDEFAPFLLTQSGAGVGAGLDALKEGSGLMAIRADGICPGTTCASGGPVDSTGIKHGPVLGGSRCGLCRYWITGPIHLLGQVTEVNNLAYRIRKQGLEVASLSDQKIQHEDAGEKRKAWELGCRIDNMKHTLELDLNEWAARYRYAADSYKLMDKYLAAKAASGDARVPMLVADAEDLKVTLESAHEFVLLDHITQCNEFVSGFENREAFLEKNSILSKMMDANGIRPFLLSLTKEHALEAGNLLSNLILQQVESRHLDDFLNGRLPLSQFPVVSHAVSVLDRKSAGLEALPWRQVIAGLEVDSPSD
jgi:hypothetical protein